MTESEKQEFDTRSAQVLEQTLSSGLFEARNITIAKDKLVFDISENQKMCSAYLLSQTAAVGVINIIWEDFAGASPYSIFAYSGRECTLRDGVTFAELCARCFQVNQDTPLSNVYFRIDEPERFEKKGKGYLVCIAGLPLLPFEAQINYEDGVSALQTMFVGAMESAFAGEQMIEAFFEGYLD